jgi:hypothetical protein
MMAASPLFIFFLGAWLMFAFLVLRLPTFGSGLWRILQAQQAKEFF